MLMFLQLDFRRILFHQVHNPLGALAKKNKYVYIYFCNEIKRVRVTCSGESIINYPFRHSTNPL